jgi:hypothetical protein
MCFLIDRLTDKLSLMDNMMNKLDLGDHHVVAVEVGGDRCVVAIVADIEIFVILAISYCFTIGQHAAIFAIFLKKIYY